VHIYVNIYKHIYIFISVCVCIYKNTNVRILVNNYYVFTIYISIFNEDVHLGVYISMIYVFRYTCVDMYEYLYIIL